MTVMQSVGTREKHFMTQLIFYEKPGCVGNNRQKALLRAQGIVFEVKDLLTTPWTVESLRPFFGNKPVAQWFNDSAPKVKSGEIDIHTLSETQALKMMLQEPLLIRRPLLDLDKKKQSGFTAGIVLDALGVVLEAEKDLQSCPKETSATTCEVSS